MNFKTYRLNNNQELIHLATRLGDRFAPFYDTVCRTLDEQPIGGTFDIEKEVHSTNFNLFVKCACHHIIFVNRTSHKSNNWLEFTDDYSSIRRMSHGHMYKH